MTTLERAQAVVALPSATVEELAADIATALDEAEARGAERERAAIIAHIEMMLGKAVNFPLSSLCDWLEARGQ